MPDADSSFSLALAKYLRCLSECTLTRQTYERVVVVVHPGPPAVHARVNRPGDTAANPRTEPGFPATVISTVHDLSSFSRRN